MYVSLLLERPHVKLYAPKNEILEQSLFQFASLPLVEMGKR